MSHETSPATRSPKVMVTDVEDVSGVQHDPAVGSPNDNDGLDTHEDTHEHIVDAVHRSHHVDSGLDVSGDIDEDDNRNLDGVLQNVSLHDQPAHGKPTLPSSTTPIDIPLPVSPRQEYIYADSHPARPKSTSPKPYSKPTVISASVSLPIPNLTINTALAAASVDPA
ncbi:hypothetical protein FRC08_011045, partial [Ceratobasidium sp. 394]